MAAKDRNSDSTIITCLTNYRQEADIARRDRMTKNKNNYDCYHLKQDFSYKKDGQSAEFLPKMSMAVEQGANFLQQGLTDLGEWYKVEAEDGVIEDMMKVKPSEIHKILSRQLQKDGFTYKIADAVKLGFIGSLMIAKVHGEMVPSPKYRAKPKLKDGTFSTILVKVEDKHWQLRVDLVRQEDFFPDPTGAGLYTLEDSYMDYYELERLSQGKDAIYDPKVVKQLKGTYSAKGVLKDYDKSRETGQNPSNNGYRNQIKITEIWGNILDEDGTLLYENVVCTVANDQYVIRKPTPNPYWHGENPYVVTPVVRVPNSVWGRALMDAPVMLNKAINELFNLVLDGGMMAVHGIKEINESWLEDPAQIANGIGAGDTLRRNSSAPAGVPALSRVDTSSVPADGMNVLNLINQEFNAASLTNDLRLGVAPARSVKATEVVEASQSITSMFSGIAKQIESEFVAKILEKGWKVCAQNIADMDEYYMKTLLGDKRAGDIKNMPSEEMFAETVGKCIFRVFGVSATLNKQKDFTKIQSLLQTVSSVPVLQEAFSKEYSFEKLLGEVISSLDIDKSKIQNDEKQQAPQAGPDAGTPGNAEVTNQQSQIPQAGAAGNQGDQSFSAQAGIPTTKFPASKATPAGGF